MADVARYRVLTLTDPAKDSTIYVTDTATRQIVKVVSTKPGDKGQVTITYGIPKTVSPPPASQVADTSNLGLL